jgi:hypothetical protein
MGKNELAAIEAQAQQQTFQIDCPAGCKISYRDPNAPVSIPRNTNGWDAAVSMTNAVAGVVGAAVVPAAMGYMAIEGFKAMRNHGAIDNSVAGDVNTGNTGRINSNDDSTHTPEIVTQPPSTIVTQPSPVIVPSPEPLIVEQPDPIVIDQPTLVPGGT